MTFTHQHYRVNNCKDTYEIIRSIEEWFRYFFFLPFWVRANERFKDANIQILGWLPEQNSESDTWIPSITWDRSLSRKKTPEHQWKSYSPHSTASCLFTAKSLGGCWATPSFHQTSCWPMATVLCYSRGAVNLKSLRWRRAGLCLLADCYRYEVH